MKTRHLLFNLVVALLAITFFSVSAQVPTAPPAPPATGGGANPFLDESKNTTETLHNAITKLPYTFLAGSYTMHLTFKSDGTGFEEDWKFKWHAKDGLTVELQELGKDGKPDGKKTTLTFSSDYTSYTGHHFDGIMVVSGKQVQKP